MEQRDFWAGFGCGVASAIGGALLASRLRRGGQSRILRLEKSIQIAAPVDRVFDRWNNFEELAQLTSSIDRVRSYGRRSHWVAKVGGLPVEWDAEVTQIIPNQSIGWKSISGPKHSGRVTFSRIGDDTLVHVQMNYAPPARVMRSLLAPFSGDLEGYIEQALRDIKTALEAQPATAQSRKAHEDAVGRATGTYGPGPELITEKQNAKFGSPSTPVEYTAPPEAKR